jgi:hypothetical protein
MRISPVYINVLNNPQKSSATYMKLKINKQEIKSIVDSRAEVTLKSKALAKKLKLRITKMNDNVQYIATIKLIGMNISKQLYLHIIRANRRLL